MLALQVALSALGNGLTLLVVALLLRDARHILSARIAVALFSCSIGYSIIMLDGSLHLVRPVVQGAVVLNAFTASLGWLFGRALLEDDFHLGRLEWSVFGALTTLALGANLEVFGIAWPGQDLVRLVGYYASLAVMAHVAWIALSGFRNDLVNARRLARAWFLLFVILSYVVLMVMDALAFSTVWLGVVYDVTTILINVSIVLWAGELRLQQLAPDAPAPAVPSLTPQQAKAWRKLEALMEHEHVYREPGLSIRALSARLGLPEHQLRALINGALGHRNFAAFLNGYRLTEARTALSDPEEGRSILVIALDSGFQSLSTLNRAFRREYDETPSDFRRRHVSTI
jgi:AraC-like DNA-binding protein